MLYAGKDFVCLAFLTDKHAHQLQPFRLSQRVQFLIPQMRHKCDAGLADGVVAAAFRRRNKDDVGVGGKNQLRIELTLHAYLDDASVPYPSFDVLVEEVLGPRDALHDVVRLERREVRELQSRHADGAGDGHLHLPVVAVHLHVGRPDQRKAVVLPDADKPHVRRVAHPELRRIVHPDRHERILAG